MREAPLQATTWHDAPMNIVDLNDSGRPSETGSGAPAGWSRLLDPARASAILVVVGFALVMASQWFPWVRISATVSIFASDDNITSVPTSAGMTSADVLQIPYYIVWVVVFVCCGALVYATGPRQRAYFGAAAGALAAQALIVVPVLHRPMALVNDGFSPDGIRQAHIVHASGSYCVIAAFVVLAAAMLIAVGGRVLPSRSDAVVQRQRPAVELVEDAPANHSMHAALADTAAGPGSSDADIEFGWTTTRRTEPRSAKTHEGIGAEVEADHSPYVRPGKS